MSNTIEIIDCGLKDYKTVLALQENTHQSLQTGSGCEKIFLVEHSPVITLGARTAANKLTKDADEIKKAGIEIFQIRRGGGATAHNPGQIVVYPVINLKKHNLGVSDYVHLLEKIGIEFLAELGVHCQTKKGFPGLWIENKNSVNPCESASEINSVNPRPSASKKNSVNPCPCNLRNPWLKIASIGVQVKKWITLHGIALNINNDLSIFDYIVPCGLENVKMTSVEEELRLRQGYGGQVGKKIDIKTAKNTLKKILLKYFTG